MATACVAQVTFQFEPKDKPVVVAFDTPDASSDGGLILLKGIDTHLGLTKRLAACLADERQPAKVRHETIELLRQRVFGFAAGYADCNDAARLADDVIHKLVVGRDPIAGPALASQPTLSRFENAVGRRELIAMGHVLADTVIEHHRRRLKGRATRITIDLDPTDDPTHGQQEFSFFNGHYDTWCYLPMVAAVTFNEETEQFAAAAVLRPGNAPALRGARGLLRRLLRQLRAAFPSAVFRVRLDGGFASAQLFAFLEREQVEYVVAMPSNARLDKRARRLMGKARLLSRTTGRTAHLYGETRYAARTWKRKRRVIIKAEVVRHPARARGRHRLCRRPGHDAARALAQTRGVGRALGAPDRAALATELPLASDVVAGRSRRGRDLVARLLPGRAGTRALVSRRGPTAAALKRADTPRRTLLSELPTRSAARWPEPGLLGAARAVERAVPVTHE